MELIDLDVQDGMGTIEVCVGAFSEVDRIRRFCRWAIKQDQALEDLREVAQAVVDEWHGARNEGDVDDAINKLRAELEKKS